jgi:signal transduction histidine kinase
VRVWRQGQQARVAVRDQGVGVPPDQRGRLFDRFFQARGSERMGGMGLGLYISRQIVELHGGRLSAEFPRGRGTRMIVALPLSGELLAKGKTKRGRH